MKKQIKKRIAKLMLCVFTCNILTTSATKPMAVPVIITVPTAKVLITTGAALVGIVASFFLVKNIPMPTPQVVIPTIANDITKGIIEAEKTLGTSAIPEAVQLAQAKAHVEALTKTVSENIAN